MATIASGTGIESPSGASRRRLHNRSATLLALGAAWLQACSSTVADPPLGRGGETTTETDTGTGPEAVLGMPNVRATRDLASGVRILKGDTGIALPDRLREARPGDESADVLHAFGAALGATGTERLTVYANNKLSLGAGYQTLTFTQTIRGIPVRGAGVVVGADLATGRVDTVGSGFLPDIGLPTAPTIDAATAVNVALSVHPGGGADASAATLAYLPPRPDWETARLVWQVDVSPGPDDDEPLEVLVDATDATLVAQSPIGLHASFAVRTFSADASAVDPFGVPQVMRRVNRGEDSLVDEGLANYRVAEGAWLRSGLDIPLPDVDLVFHYGPPGSLSRFNATTLVRLNAGRQIVAFGDGGALPFPFHGARRTFGPSGSNLDVVAHEYGHVRQLTRRRIEGPIPFEEGAVFEALADLSSVLVALGSGPVSFFAAFEIMEGSYVNNPTEPIRSINSPTKTFGIDWYPNLARQPGMEQDSGLVAAYAYKLLVTGGPHERAGQPAAGPGTPPIPTIVVPAVPLHVAQQIFFNAEASDPAFKANPNFLTFADATIRIADLFFPLAVNSVRAAWAAVGIRNGCTAPPGPPFVHVETAFCFGQHTKSWFSEGATHYYGEQTRQLWALGQPVVDVNSDIQSCQGTAGGPSRFRLMACNGCGCSGWAEATIPYFPSCL
jgi:Zn-dependent metalloprotease